MKRKRFIVLLLTSALMVSMLTVNASAASKSKMKTVYVPTSISTESNTGGHTASYTYQIKYNKKGMPYKIILPQGSDVFYKYNKNGFVKGTYNTYNNGGRSDITYFKVNRRGLITKIYDTNSTFKYGKKGRPLSYKSTDVHIKYDRYGNMKSYISKYGSELIEKSVYSLKLDKKGNIVKEIKKSTFRDLSRTTTTNVKYTYDKHGNIKEKNVSSKKNNGFTSTFNITYKYKKVRVNKKSVTFLKYVKWKATHSLTGDLIGLEYAE